MTKVIGYSIQSVNAAIYKDEAGLYVFTAQDAHDPLHPKINRVVDSYEHAKELFEGFIARQWQ